MVLIKYFLPFGSYFTNNFIFNFALYVVIIRRLLTFCTFQKYKLLLLLLSSCFKVQRQIFTTMMTVVINISNTNLINHLSYSCAKYNIVHTDPEQTVALRITGCIVVPINTRYFAIQLTLQLYITLYDTTGLRR